MNENSKLYVFAKKEVALIFIFMLLLAVSAFALGVKIGKNYSYLESGYTPEDRAKVDLLSAEEEQLNETIEKREKVDPQKLKDETHKALEERLKEQLEEKPAPAPAPVEVTPETTQVSGDDFTGKFTIQLG